jgi:hypothetical protein
VLSRLRKRWRDFKALPAGKRFQAIYEQQQGSPAWVKPVVIAGAVICFVIGVLLSVLPGPAFVFYGLTGALLAVESRWVARTLDHGELAARKRITRFRNWREKRRTAHRRNADTRA